VIPAVGLEEVNVLGAKTTKALVEFMKYRFAGEAPSIRLIAHDAVGLGGNDDGFPAGVCF